MDIESDVMCIPLQILCRYLESIIVTWTLILIFLHSLDIVYNCFTVFRCTLLLRVNVCVCVCGVGSARLAREHGLLQVLSAEFSIQ